MVIIMVPYLFLLLECGVDSPLATFSRGLSTQLGNSGKLGGLRKLSGLYSKSVKLLLGWLSICGLSLSLVYGEDSIITLWTYSSTTSWSLGDFLVGGKFSKSYNTIYIK